MTQDEKDSESALGLVLVNEPHAEAERQMGRNVSQAEADRGPGGELHTGRWEHRVGPPSHASASLSLATCLVTIASVVGYSQ